MFAILSMITTVKDYVEIVHKVIETDSLNSSSVFTHYSDFGAIVTYSILFMKQFLVDLLSFKWLQSVYSLPVIVPDIASAMISEISVFDGYFHNAFTFLETPTSYGNQNVLFSCLEKFSVGILNSFFLFLPTSTAHLVCLRRFVMQGLEAGYIAGLGTIAGNLVWIGSLIFGLRFLMIPWLSLDILRYLLGFILLVKYMWDSYSEKRVVLEDLSKQKIFLLNFLLAFTEQSNIYPFLSNLSIGSDSSFIESFPTETFGGFVGIHGAYLIGMFLGSFSLLQLTCWFWENPAFQIYMWMVSSFKVTTGLYYKVLNFIFLYLTMICAISSVSYFGVDYMITNPLGFVHEDRLLDQKALLETSFLNTKASDRNTRRNRGRHGRRERWKRRVRRYRTFDASLYDQGVYDLFTIEDLNYGFDRFWLRRKMRNHRVHFRFFPGPWMRSFKKQLSRPRLESFMGPRVEFFRILFEQVYHPEFHEYQKNQSPPPSSLLGRSPENLALNASNALTQGEQNPKIQSRSLPFISLSVQKQSASVSNIQSIYPLYNESVLKTPKAGLLKEYSALRKFIRKFNRRIKSSTILSSLNQNQFRQGNRDAFESLIQTGPIYSKRWKYLFSKFSHEITTSSQKSQENLFRRLYNNVLSKNSQNSGIFNASKKQDRLEKRSKKDLQILKYKSFLKQQTTDSPLTSAFTNKSSNSKEMLKNADKVPIETLSSMKSVPSIEAFGSSSSLSKKQQVDSNENMNAFTLLHPIQFYLKKEQAFQKKMKFYGPNVYRTFGVENNAPYFKTMMQRFFYYYKPIRRWERTMRTATMRKALRKTPRVVRKQNLSQKTKGLASLSVDFDSNSFGTSNLQMANPEKRFVAVRNEIQKPSHFYSLVNKRATRYRSQIYKDVLQHWYYSPFNRLLLKFDVDSFIRRQPRSYFLTKEEEQLLHVRRTLLSEHYETLRWYCYMQHYNSMKTKIGGTKSFASRSYSQQFMGTFKKVRHLFAMTPSGSDNTILKFDQPLYNEYSNSKTQSILAESLLHEELFADEDMFSTNSLNTGEDFTDQSKNVIRQYLLKSTPLREEVLRKFLEENNSWEFTKFLFRGQKQSGSNFLNEQDFFNAFVNPSYKDGADNKSLKSNENSNYVSFSKESTEVQQKLWIELLKKCQNTLYDQESLKNYLVAHVEKRTKQQQRQKKYLTSRLERLKNWFLEAKNQTKDPNAFASFTGVRTGIQKGIQDSVLFQKGFTQNGSTPFSKKEVSSSLKNHFTNRLKEKRLELFKVEHDLKQTLKASLKMSDSSDQSSSVKLREKCFSILSKTLMPFTYLSKQTVQILFMKPAVFLKKIQQRDSLENIDESMDQWRKQEIALTKRKKTRKPLKRLRNTNQKNRFEGPSLSEKADQFLKRSEPSRQKRNVDSGVSDDSKIFHLEKQRRMKAWNQWKRQGYKTGTLYGQSEKSSSSLKIPFFSKLNLFRPSNDGFSNDFLSKKFKRKRTRLRRYRRFKTRGPIKKRTLGEKLKRQFKLLKRYQRSSATSETSADQKTSSLNRSEKKMEIFKMITKRNYDPNNEFLLREIKQRRVRQNKQRFWKQKKQKFAQNKRKQRKRRRYAAGKIRNLFKNYKRQEAALQIQRWWWDHFLPNFRATAINSFSGVNPSSSESQERLSNFLKASDQEILSLDFKNPNLQIGDYDSKPLGTAEAIRLRKSFEQEKSHSKAKETILEKLEQSEKTKPLAEIDLQASSSVPLSSLENPISKMTEKAFTKRSSIENLSESLQQNSGFSKQITSLNPTPFYAGWDESLRKFVVTNRFLSIQNQQNSLDSLNKENPRASEFHFPLKGMNAATTLYWQVPFTTYDPDQFFALGMDGFSPIGWRRFHFRHSKQTTKPILVQTKTNLEPFDQQKMLKSTLSSNLQQKMLKSHLFSKNPQASTSFSKTQKNERRRTQKRYKRVKKHPRPPVWFPSGPLSNQVLPVHYIYIFYKRSRLPRDRYIRRRLRKNSQNPSKSFSGKVGAENSNSYREGSSNAFTQMTDFTFRKRAKPRRKYHRKRHFSSSQNSNENFILKRRAFRGVQRIDEERSRPTPSNFTLSNDFSMTRKQKRKKDGKQSAENLRIRQLRRRVQRQVIRPVLRYKPKAGGFVWPGDYLRFERVKAPLLNSFSDSKSNFEKENSAISNSTSKSRKTKKKKRKAIQEWQIQPKKYLLQKHNLNVLRKRLQKSQNSYLIF